MSQFKKVLLVDDDPTQLIILHAYFSGFDCGAIIETSSAKQALAALEEHGNSVNLIVSDIMMPDMDGIELLRAVKEKGYNGAIAFISGLQQTLIDSVKKLAELHQLNVIGTCRKPLNKQNLDSVFYGVSLEGKVDHHHDGGGVNHEEVAYGLDKAQFLPYYQPKVEVLSGRIVGVEALARWEHPDKGLLSPALFMPLVEAYNLTGQLTSLMFRKALADMAQWQKNNVTVKVALNVTASEVTDLAFPQTIRQLIEEFGVNAKHLVIEITENEVLEFNVTSLEVLARLRLMGIDIAIDDFGTGYSNLKTLKEFPYTELKIDQAFIRGMTKDSFSQETVRVAVTLGRQLNMRLLAEGVETLDEWEFVKQRGIDEVQGFFIAKPMPATDFTLFYNKAGGMVDIANDKRTSLSNNISQTFAHM